MCSVDDIGIDGVLEADGSTLDTSNWGVADISLDPSNYEEFWNPVETLKWSVEQLIEQPDIPDQIKGILVTKTGNTQSIPVIYGARRIGGIRVFISVSGGSNEYLHIVLVLGEGSLQSIGSVWINDDEVTDADIDSNGNVISGKFSGLLRIKKHLGTDTQVADADLVLDIAEWDSSHQLKGVAYLYLRCKWDQDNRAFGSFPRTRADVLGKLLFDPRSSTTNYSNNPALCLYDYLTNTRYGRGLLATDIDQQSFIDAADYCDEQVTPYNGATSTISRYSCDGLVNTGRELLDNIKVLLSCMRGWLPYVSGKWTLLLDKPETQQFVFDESNIMGSMSISKGGKSTRLNHVETSYANPDEDYQPDIVVIDSAVFRSEDNNLLLQKRIGLQYTVNQYRASHLAELAMKQSRQGLSVSLKSTLAAYEVSVGQVVGITHASPGWLNKPFRVSSAKLLPDSSMSFSMTEYDGSVYNLTLPTAAPTPLDTNLPDPNIVAAPADLLLYSGTDELILASDGTIINRIRATWTPVDNAFVDEYDVEYRINTNVPTLLSETFDTVTGSTQTLNCNISIDANRLLQQSFAGFSPTNVYWPLTVTPNQEITILIDYQVGSQFSGGQLSVGTDIFGTSRNDIGSTVMVFTDQALLLTVTPTMSTIYIFGWIFGGGAFGYWDNLQVVVGNGIPVPIAYLPAANPKGATADTAYITGLKDGDDVDVRVRAVNTNGVASQWLEQLGHIVIGKTELPPAVNNFLVQRQSDGTREFNWTATRPVDFAGYEIRFKLGTGHAWEDMTPLHKGLLSSSPYETNQLAAGTYTVGIKMRDTTQNESETAKIIESTLGDPRISGSVGGADMRATDWPGIKTNSWVDNDGILVAKDTKTWGDLGVDGITWATWLSWARLPNSTIIYEHPTIDIGATTVFTPLISVIANGAVSVEESHSDDNISYTAWATTGSQVSARYVKTKITVINTASLANITQGVIILSADPVEEVIEDLDTSTLTDNFRIGVGDIRLPITKSYAVIKKINLALQNVGAGWTWDQIDKNITIGPRIKIYNKSGSLADATIDAEIKGV